MSEKCAQCQAYEFKQRTGSWPSGASFVQWSMWGCTCTPEAAEEALAYIRLVSE